MPSAAEEKRIDWPSYWLVALERAVAAGDYPAAAIAQAELRRLGIEVILRHISTEHKEVERDK